MSLLQELELGGLTQLLAQPPQPGSIKQGSAGPVLQPELPNCPADSGQAQMSSLMAQIAARLRQAEQLVLAASPPDRASPVPSTIGC